jgi:uncharacterized membrane protein YfcA
MIASERLYPIRRPLAAASAGAAVALLGGLIGLGGAEFRLPLLIAVFALYPHRAIRINLLISLATLIMSAVSRLSFVHATSVTEYKVEIGSMLVGGIIAAWLGAGYLSASPRARSWASLLYCSSARPGCWQSKPASREPHGRCWLRKARGVRPPLQ